MKKIICALAVFLMLAGTTRVAAQEHQQRVRFYYYPSNNVYYNVTDKEYWYYDEPTTKWVEVQTLPATIVVQKTPRYTVYYNGPDVWKDNDTHKKKYKANKKDVKKMQ